jgi:GTP cyclohydrolase I
MTEPSFEVDYPRIELAVREILAAIGEDPERDGLIDTPSRVARMYGEVCAGLALDPDRHLAKTFDVDHDEMVMVRDIPMYSLCEHHLLPFTGVAHCAYIPKAGGRITGISKLARVVDEYARRPQVQERLTRQVADAIQRQLEPRGALVVIEAEHLCMSMRGVRKPGSTTITSAVHGIFRNEVSTRLEAMRLLGGT